MQLCLLFFSFNLHSVLISLQLHLSYHYQSISPKWQVIIYFCSSTLSYWLSIIWSMQQNVTEPFYQAAIRSVCLFRLNTTVMWCLGNQTLYRGESQNMVDTWILYLNFCRAAVCEYIILLRNEMKRSWGQSWLKDEAKFYQNLTAQGQLKQWWPNC